MGQFPSQRIQEVNRRRATIGRAPEKQLKMSSHFPSIRQPEHENDFHHDDDEDARRRVIALHLGKEFTYLSIRVGIQVRRC